MYSKTYAASAMAYCVFGFGYASRSPFKKFSHQKKTESLMRKIFHINLFIQKQKHFKVSLLHFPHYF